MTLPLRGLQRAKRALRARCRLHPSEPAAACQACHSLALLQQDSQVRRERKAAHEVYLERMRNPQ